MNPRKSRAVCKVLNIKMQRKTHSIFTKRKKLTTSGLFQYKQTELLGADYISPAGQVCRDVFQPGIT